MTINISLSWTCRLFQRLTTLSVSSQSTRSISVKKAEVGGKKKIGKFGAVVEKKVLDVETDAHRLVNYCCGTNLLKEGGEDVKLKPDSEYPDWLWSIRTGKAPTLDELDPNTLEYWKKVRKLGRKRANQLRKIRKF